MAMFTVPYIASVPTTGQTVSFQNNEMDQILYINPAGDLLALTVSVPSNSTSRLGQRVYFCCRVAVTTLTMSGSTNILNSVPTLLGNECLGFIKVADNVWARMTT